MRVADTTEVSGRVTADEVNLDRFHNRIRKVCTLGRTWLALVAASVGLYLVLPDRGLAQSITLGTLKGTYVSSQPVVYTTTTTSNNLTLMTQAVVAIFDGKGNLSGMSTGAAVTPGAPVSNFQGATFTGTYMVNPDGMRMSVIVGSEQFDLYPTLDGSTFALISTKPGLFESAALFTRSSGKALLNP
jgi:hypothetical protein